MNKKSKKLFRQYFHELKNAFLGKQSPISKLLGLNWVNPNPDIEISFEEDRFHHNCVISKKERKCLTYCFKISWKDNIEYDTSYKENGIIIAKGSTDDKQEMINSIKDWIEQKPLEQLYTKYNFIDKEKRQLLQIRAVINKANPDLLRISENSVTNVNFSTYNILFKNQDRSCRIFYDQKPNPKYCFRWNDTNIFEVHNSDIKRLACLIYKWVLEKRMPSTLKEIYPEIDFGKLAEYYEKGNGIAGEFILSWDNIELFYNTVINDKGAEILQLIEEIRKNGFDKTLRAGQSLYTLVLSRSRRYGLRINQKRVMFSFTLNQSAMEILTTDGTKVEFKKIEYNEIVEEILKKLELESID